MQEGEGLDKKNGIFTHTSNPVQGFPWWGEVAQPTMLEVATTNHATHDRPGCTVGLSSTTRPSGLVQLVAPQAATTTHGLVQNLADGPVAGTVPMQSWASSGNDCEQHLTSVAPSAPVVLGSQAEYSLPLTQLELGHSMVRTAYPYADPYYGGMMAAYGAQGMIYPYIFGVQHARMPLPSEMTEEEPVYVNAKQYNGILRRRQSRAKAESENKLIKSRKPYLHESRHLHAMRRARGCGGRFLNTKQKDDQKNNSSNNVSSEGQSSQEGTAFDSCKMLVSECVDGFPTQGYTAKQGMTSHLMAGVGQSVVSGSGGCCSGRLVQIGHPIMSSGLPFGT